MELDDEEIELEMLTQQCEELLAKLMQQSSPKSQSQPSFNEDDDVKREKYRLEREYVELCVEIQRQQNQLEQFKHKIRLSSKEAEYYSRQIKEKEEILQSLEKHQLDKKRKQKH